MLKKLSDHPTAGLIGLCWMNAGTRNVYNSKKPIKTVEDLKGLKIRMMGNPVFVDTMNCARRQRRRDGLRPAHQRACRPASSTARRTTSRATRAASTIATPSTTRKTGHLMIPEILVFSKKTWEALSKDDQALIMKLAKEAQQEQRKLWYEREKKSLDEDEGGRRRDQRRRRQEAVPGGGEAGLGQVRRASTAR